MLQRTAAILSLALVFAPAGVRGAETDVYSVLPLLPETAKALHVTVNGIFGGVVTPDPVLPSARFSAEIPKRFHSAAAYAKAVHAAGQQVGAHIHGTQLVPEVLADFPGLDQATCRDAKGGRPYFDKSQNGLFMCANNPQWATWQVERGKRAVDAGADQILIDEPQGNALALNPAVGSPGFCSYCREAFARDMRSRGTELPAKWVKSVGDSSIFRRHLAQKIEREPLIPTFLRFQRRSQYAAVARLAAELREYAASSGHEVRIGGNLSFLDAFSVLDYWFRAVFLADLLDFVGFECQYNPSGNVTEQLPLPRGKWIAWHKLANAISVDRPIASVSSPTIGAITQEAYGRGPNRSQQLAALFVEAYVAGSALAFYTLELPGLDPERLWGPMAEMAAFVRAHPELYRRDFETPAEVAVLYRDGPGMAVRNHSYLGIAQALAEGNVPFALIFVSDPDFQGLGHARKTLGAKTLAGYRSVVIPSALDFSPGEVESIRAFVEGGGRAVIVDAEVFGHAAAKEGQTVSSGAGSYAFLPPDRDGADAGKRFYHDYQTDERQLIVRAVGDGSGLGIAKGPSDVLLYLNRDPDGGRTIVHAVNYRYDLKRNRIAPVKQLRIRIPLDPASARGATAKLLRPGAAPETLRLRPVTGKPGGDPAAASGVWEVKIEDLATYAVIVVDEAPRTPATRAPRRSRKGNAL